MKEENNRQLNYSLVDLDHWNTDYYVKSNGVTKSVNDPYTYETFTLPNGLQVFLIENADSSVSAAALNVSVGSKLDPAKFPGLAHYCEHSLLLGSQQYPQSDYLSEFLSNNGGGQNACTSWDHTTYYFSVERQSFAHALQVWSCNFHSPLFDTTSLEKEVSAVDSEHKKNIRDDQWRLIRSVSCAIREEHPLHKFNGGNAETLLGPKRDGISNLKRALLDFYQKQYLSDKMTLLVYHHQISGIRTLIQTEFNKINRASSPNTTTMSIESAIFTQYVLSTQYGPYGPYTQYVLANQSDFAQQQIEETLSYEGKDKSIWARNSVLEEQSGIYKVPVSIYEKVGGKNRLNVLVSCPNLNYGRKTNQFSHGMSLLGALITNPRAGGLRDRLKSRELIHGLNFEPILETDNMVIININFSLVPGSQSSLILEYLFHYINTLTQLRLKDIKDSYEELLRLQRLKFLDLCLPEGVEFAQTLLHCLNTTQVALTELLSYNMEPCNLEITFEHFQRLLEHFDPKRWQIITTCDPKTGLTPNTNLDNFVWPTKETFYQMGLYESIIEFQINSNNPFISNNITPEPNPYLPRVLQIPKPVVPFPTFNSQTTLGLNTSVKSTPIVKPKPIPIKTDKENVSVFWDGYNNYYNLSGFARFKITNQAISPKTQVALTLYIHYLGEKYQEHFLRINEINKIDINVNGSSIVVNSVFLSHEVIKGAFEILFSALKPGYIFDKESWQTAILKESEQIYELLESNPLHQMEEVARNELLPEYCISLWERLELVQLMTNSSGEDIHRLISPFWSNEVNEVKGYFTGNVSKVAAEMVTESIMAELGKLDAINILNPEPYLANYDKLLCIRNTGPVSKKVVLTHHQPAEKNSVLRYSVYLDTLQNGVTEESQLLTSAACTTILATIFQHHYHEKLRGQLELGYILGCSPLPLNLHCYRRETYLSFFIQSPVAKSARLIAETERFLDDMVRHLMSMPSLVFDQMKQSIANGFREPEKNVNIHLEKQFHYLSGTEPGSVPDWDRSYKVAISLEQLSHTTLVEYFRERWVTKRETIIIGMDCQ